MWHHHEQEDELFLVLRGRLLMQFRDRDHVLATAARMMRRVLIDYADRRRAQKRGSGEISVPLDESLMAIEEHVDELRALDEALDRLGAINSRHAQVVECRFFAGLSVDETAAALSLSPATVKRDWANARKPSPLKAMCWLAVWRSRKQRSRG